MLQECNLFNRFIQTADSIRNESINCLYEWAIESLTHSIRSKMWIHSVIKQRCVLLGDTQHFFSVALIATILVGEIEQKQSLFCLKSKSLNFNLLFIKYYCLKSWHIAIVLILLFGETS